MAAPSTAVGNFVGIDRLEAKAGRDRYHRQLRHALDHDQDAAMVELGCAVGKRRPILHMGMPGGAAAAIRAGANLAPERAVGRCTWEDFLTTEVARRSLWGSLIRPQVGYPELA